MWLVSVSEPRFNSSKGIMQLVARSNSHHIAIEVHRHHHKLCTVSVHHSETVARLDCSLKFFGELRQVWLEEGEQ
jgi:hypothetical protein